MLPTGQLTGHGFGTAGVLSGPNDGTWVVQGDARSRVVSSNARATDRGQGNRSRPRPGGAKAFERQVAQSGAD